MQDALEYFSIFGGLDIKIDMKKPIEELIKKHILEQYNTLRNKINTFTDGYGVNHAILSAAAIGDRRTNSSFKKAFVSFEEGMKCVDNLCDECIIELESSANYLAKQRNVQKISKKIVFTTPFFRFWFAFISPIYKGIKEGDFKEFDTIFANNKNEFYKYIFEELSLDYTLKYFGRENIKKFGKYWDNENQIDIIVKTKDDKLIVGICKYSNSKVKKSELNRLKDLCKKANLDVDIFVLFSKEGYSSELKSSRSDELKLFTIKSLKLLLD